MTKRIFNRFKPHRMGIFLEYDYVAKTITWRPDGAPGRTTEHVQQDLDIELERLSYGTRLRVQDGELTKRSSEALDGRRLVPTGPRSYLKMVQTHVGKPCIAAIGHEHPTLSLLTLRVMEDMLGTEATAGHLADFRDGASTRQNHIEVNLPDGRSLSLTVKDGHLRAARSFGGSGVSVAHEEVQFPAAGLPDTVVSALEGGPIGRLIGHPAFSDPELVIAEIKVPKTGRASARIRPVMLTPDRAIALLRAPLAIAA